MRDKSEDPKHLMGYVDAVVETIAGVTGCSDVRRGVEAGLDCEVRAALVSSWRRYVQVPDDQPEAWFVHGSPMGLLEAPLTRNIFPEYDAVHPEVPHSSLTSAESKSERRLSAQGDPGAIAEMTVMTRRSWIDQFKSKCAAKRAVKGRLVMSKLIVITKEKS